MRRPLATLVAAVLLCGASASAQWLNYREPGIPRTKDGKANLAAAAPRTLDGKPDLSGVWKAEITPVAEWRRRLGDEAVALRLATRIEGIGIGTTSVMLNENERDREHMVR